jgi:peptidoglycan/xylan/chitin deacetylase (PgdA/CDA1 family)
MPSIRRLLFARAALAALPALRKVPRVRRLLARSVIVLGYHDLRAPGDVDSWLRVDVTVFREHLRLLSSIGTFIGPMQFKKIGELPGQGPRVMLTFDDGYLNWLRLGVPVLEEFGIPALFFVSSENLVSRRPYWFDRVILAVQGTATTRLDLREYGLHEYRFRTGPASRRWDDIQRLLTDIKRLGDPGDAPVESVLERMDWLAAGAANRDLHYRSVSTAELVEMARSRHCHFGSHGHRHSILTRLDYSPLLEGLLRSKESLESVTGRSIGELAYPNGDCNDRVVMAAREAGYERAFTTAPDWFKVGTDVFRVPRLLVGGYDSRVKLGNQLGALLFRHIFTALKERSAAAAAVRAS